MNNVLIYDCETLRGMFLIIVYNIQTKEWFTFEISERKCEIDKFVNFTEEYKDYYFCGYNCLRFDSQVIEYVLRNYQFWVEKSCKEICQLVWQKAQDVIDDANYEIFPDYKENELSLKQLDLFTIWHFNNINRRTSLKAIEFAINFGSIEEMPYHHSKEFFTEEEYEEVISYCVNDVSATYALYLITIGETEMELFRGENKIEDRLTMKEEFGLSCLNWDDVKIGAEWNKMDYMAQTHKSEKDLKPDVINYPYGKKFRKFFPKTVKFQTIALRSSIKQIGEYYVLNKFQEFKFKFNDELIATIAKGGIHSNEKGRFLKPKENEIYFQIDISSQYPNAIRKYKIEPGHLPGWNSLIIKKIQRRLEYKSLYQNTKNPKYNSIQKMGKLALNGGSYGRLNTKGDWQQDPSCMLKVTIGGQLEILMIVEDLLLRGFRVVSLNTDGFDVILLRDREEEFRTILTEWEKIIGNDELGNFEYTEFLWIAQTSVNDYLALKADGTTKVKGDFEINKELHKNNSHRIIPIALCNYFVDGRRVDDTIRQHTNIFDFCIRQKASKDFHYEGVKNGITNVYNKLIRYYVSNDGEKLYKIKNPECQTNACDVSQIEAGPWVCHVCNKLSKDHPTENINFDFYIKKTEDIIVKIDKYYKRTDNKVNQQLSLW